MLDKWTRTRSFLLALGLTVLCAVLLLAVWLRRGSSFLEDPHNEDFGDVEDPFPELKGSGSEGRFEKNLEDGSQIIGAYFGGHRTGVWLRVAPQGFVLVQGNYERGVQEGEWTIFYQGTGQMKESGAYEAGLAVGTWEMYYPNGSLFEVIEFRAGAEHGAWTMYHPDGSLADEMTWSNGKQVGQETNYDRAGRIVALGDFDDHRPSGTWTCFDSDGSKRFLAAPHRRITPREACGYGSSPEEPVLD